MEAEKHRAKRKAELFKYIEPKRVRSKSEQIEYRRQRQKAYPANKRAEQQRVADGLEAARVVDVGLVGEEVD